MPRFKQFDAFRIDVRSRDHSPPHYHAIGADFHAMIRIGTNEVLRGRIPARFLAEAIAYCEEHGERIMEEWIRLNERD